LLIDQLEKLIAVLSKRFGLTARFPYTRALQWVQDVTGVAALIAVD
jgi:hypothetical protein